ncbi:glutamate-1-semialdehyde 2,1-aminomutase [Carboxylicivirga linearis]|uniref:Glutamate-1-semialdehyde 2,1-aminomutase n=1 Tax=Carboxylicivirga linearis TaxID=1628157 RepID=A0ABS5JPA2_9BACT|nr:glutamate-1-semialdehyde 2,1-aminomutase [Carboxylicivirga linearis]MBS2096726.1 glutamate-1-semialdehyde 2,1-aminomutase [Carboxylicivirga linearis]
MNNNNSKQAFQEAQKAIPGGVNSPVRAFKSVGIDPIFIKKAKGTTVWDIDDNEYTDFVASWGPLILGHAHDDVVKAVTDAASLGTSYGAPTLIETEMAEQIVKMMPSIEKVRMVNSGTEATMSAIRLARGYTNRELIIKFAGCYHGHGDSFLIKAGSGAITLGLPDSPGVTKSTAKDTLTADYNNLDSVQELFDQHKDEIAAVIVEPVAGNMGVVPPADGFLEGLRKMTKDNGALLIFDEVITGFRLAKGGAQEYYNVMPDLTTLGKIIGGGLPVGAYGGSAEIMDMLAPIGPVYQAGTLSGNPLAMAAGLTALKKLDETPNAYEELEKKAQFVEEGLKLNAQELGLNVVLNRVGSMMTAFFTDSEQVASFDEAMSSDTSKYADYFKGMVENGLYIAPSQFECLFISMAHTEKDLEKLIKGNRKALEAIK